MNARVIRVPGTVRHKALSQGAEGRRWLERLGGLVEELERARGATAGAALHGGSASYVAAARADAGDDDTVVKLEMPPYESFAGEVQTLLADGGQGYARLLDHDEGRHAMRGRSDPSRASADRPSRPR